jgi:hypothetical protein
VSAVVTSFIPVAPIFGGIFLVIVLYTVALSAFGGYVGARYAESQTAKRDATPGTEGDEPVGDEPPVAGTIAGDGATDDESSEITD